MAHSKIVRSNFTLLILGISGLSLVTGCFRPSARDPKWLDGTEMASFTVKTLTGESVVSKQAEGTNFPEARKYTFKACVTNRLTTLPVKSQMFSIVEGKAAVENSAGEGRVLETAQTDDKGCLTWSEDLNFNYLASESYVALNRKLEPATTSQTGRADLKLAVNPWNFSGKEKDVVNLANEAEAALIPQGRLTEVNEGPMKLLGEAKADAAAARILTISKFNLTGLSLASVPDVPTKLLRTIELSLLPVISVVDLRGAAAVVDAKGLRLSLNAALIALVPQGEGQPPKKYLAWKLSDVVELSAADQAGFAVGQMHIEFQPVAVETVRYQLVVRVAPQAAGLGVHAFEGDFDLGSHAQLGGAGLLPERLKDSNAPGGTFDLEAAIQGLEPLPISN